MIHSREKKTIYGAQPQEDSDTEFHRQGYKKNSYNK